MREIQFKISFSNRALYTLIAAALIIVAGIGVYAYNSAYNNPAVFGHSADELEVSIGGAAKTLQQAIDDGDFAGTGGGSSAGTSDSSWVKSGNNVILNESGNIGIGTSSPSDFAKIHVDESSDKANFGMFIDNSYSSGGFEVVNGQNVRRGGSMVSLRTRNNGGHPYLNLGIASIINWNFGIDNTDGYKLKIGQDDLWKYQRDNAQLTITPDGKIGIGTSDPKTKLDINGEMRIGNSGAPCNSSNRGLLRYTQGTFARTCTTTTGSADNRDHIEVCVDCGSEEGYQWISLV